MYVRVYTIAIHTCPPRVYPCIILVSVSTCFSLRHEFVTASRLLISHFTLFPRRHSAYLPPFLPRVPTVIYIVLSRCTTTRGCIESHRCTCIRCTSSYTCWTNSPLGHPFDEPSRESGETRAHTDTVVPANYFCLASPKITSPKFEREQRNDVS